jgi:hypothetical protein
MGLPKLNAPTFELVVPSSKEKIVYRPFLVKEEKILLMALEAEDIDSIYRALKDVIESCIVSGNFEVENAPSFDIEYVFLNIRGKSVGEVIELKYTHPEGKNIDGDECDHVTDVAINIEEIVVNFPEDHSANIDLGNGVGVRMKYPSAEMIMNKTDTQTEAYFDVIYDCVDRVWSGEEVYSEFTREDLEAFIQSMTKSQFSEVIQFFQSIPKLTYETEFTCDKCGKKEKVVVEGLQSFFT